MTEIRNISKKIIGVYGKTLMPGDSTPVTDAEAGSSAVRSMVRAGRLEYVHGAPAEPVQPQAAADSPAGKDSASEDGKPEEKARSAGARKGTRKASGAA